MAWKWLRSRSPDFWTVFFVSLGLGLRTFRYVSNPSVWHDEAACILNVLRKSYGELLGPLLFSEASPPLFLWMQKAVSQVLGDSPAAMRLLPYLAGCLALIGTVALSRKILQPWSVVFLALLLACSEKLIWHSAEAKAYSGDVLAGTIVLALFLCSESLSVAWQLLLTALVAPFLLFASFPACFLMGGLTLGLLPRVIRAGRKTTWASFAIFMAVMGGAFLLLLLGPIQAQRDEAIVECWSALFPRWNRPWTLPGWFLMRSVEVFRYDYNPTGSILFISAVLGVIHLWREGRRSLLVVLLAPIVLAALAALVRHYPYGGFRVMVYSAPAAMVLIAAGLPPFLGWFRRLGRYGPVLPALAILFPVGQALYRVAFPWPLPDTPHASSYVLDHRAPGEMVIGTLWEHDYYFRGLEDNFQQMSPVMPGPNDRRLWLLVAGSSYENRQWYLHHILERGPWRIEEKAEFQRMTVYHLVMDSPAPPTDVGPDVLSVRPHSRP